MSANKSIGIPQQDIKIIINKTNCRRNKEQPPAKCEVLHSSTTWCDLPFFFVLSQGRALASEQPRPLFEWGF